MLVSLLSRHQLPSGLGSLSRLEEIDVERNQLSGKLPDTLTRLTKLKKLWLAENNFRGPLPVDVLEALTSLKVIRQKQCTLGLELLCVFCNARCVVAILSFLWVHLHTRVLLCQDLRFYGNKFDQWTAGSGAAMRTVSVPKSLDDFTPR